MRRSRPPATLHAAEISPRRVSVACPETVAKDKKSFSRTSRCPEKEILRFACCVFFGRNGIKSSLAEGIAPQNPPQSQRAALKKTMDLQSFHGIFRAGGNEPTAGLFIRRDMAAVKPNQPQSEAFHSFTPRSVRVFSNRSFTSFMETKPVLVRETRIKS